MRGCRMMAAKQWPSVYSVMLHNDDFNRRETVVNVLFEVFDSFTLDDAIDRMKVI